MSEKEKQLALDILGIFDRLPEVKKTEIGRGSRGLGHGLCGIGTRRSRPREGKRRGGSA